MCKRLEGEPWWSYAWRQVCENTWAVLSVAGFAVLAWYANKADEQQAKMEAMMERNETKLLNVINEQHEINRQQVQALQELTFFIKQK